MTAVIAAPLIFSKTKTQKNKMSSGVVRLGACRKLFIYAPLLGIFVFLVILANSPAKAAAGINEQINFQGRLLNSSGATVPDGYYNIEFKIYKDGDGQTAGDTTGSPAGTLLWTEDHLNNSSQGVQVKNGFLSVQLGSITAFGTSVDWNQDTLWLSMNIGGTNLTCTPFSSCSPDGEMVPMKRLSASPYALNAGQLNGLTSADFLQLAPGAAQTDASTNSSININKTNTGNFITLQASSDTAFAITNAGDILMGNNADHSLTVEAATTNVAGKSLLIGAGDAGSGASANDGGDITLQAGNAAGTGDASGGDITLQAGNKVGTGDTGRVVIKAGTGGETINPFFAVQRNDGKTILGASNTDRVYMFGVPLNNVYNLTFANDVYVSPGTPCAACEISVGSEDSIATEGDGMGVHIYAGNTSDTASNGGNVTLTAGATTGGGTNGGTIVKNAGDSSGAFVVENASGVPLFNIDSTSEIVSLGTGFTLPIPNFGTPTTSTTGGSIANGTTYYYGITASDGTTSTELSPVVSVTISSATSTNTVNLSWSESVGATSYKIYRNTTNDFSSGSLLLTTIGSGSTTTYTDTGSSTSSGLPTSTVYNPTLLRVDAAAVNPFGDGQTAQLGSMYYNTTSGEFQCYKDSGVGGTWADCGVTTLQGAYNNATNSATDAAIKLDASHGTLNIQDADTTIAADILDIRGSNGSGLGPVLFGIGNTGAVTMQNSGDQSSAMRILNSGGTYLVNVNTSSSYFITNATKSTSGNVQNPSFEAGGVITSGEEGWNAPAQFSIVNSSSNAHGGNYELQATPNATSLKAYAGTYYEVNEGDVVYFESWVKNSAGANGTGGVIIEGYDKDKSLVGSATDSGSLPGTTYVLRGTTYTVPSTVRYVRVAVVVNSGASTGTYYFDDVYMTNSRRGQVVFQNSADSTTAFQIRSSGATQTLFTVDTTNNLIKVGDNSSGTDTETMFVVDSTTADPTTLTNKDGGLYYRSDSGQLKTVISGSVYDICTTATVCSGYGASAGSVVNLQASSPGTAQTGNFNITGTGILTQLQTQDKSSASTNTSGLTIRSGNATGSGSNSGNLILDVGTATGTLGNITIGHANVSTTMPGSLDIQGSSALSLGTAGGGGATGSILFRTSAGSNTVTLQGPGSNPTSSWTMVLPQNHGAAGECLKDSSGTGTLAFGGCDPGSAVNLQNAYDNSSAPATITLADSKDLKIIAQDTSTTDPNFLIDLQCTTSCSTNGRFEVQNGGTPVLTVKPNSGGIILAQDTQIGSATTDSTQINFHLDSYNGSSDTGTCTTTTNQGALYYNSSMGSLRGCINGSWGDVTNPDTLGLLTFGIIPSSGSNPYDLPSLVTTGVTGPCKVSWNSATSVHIEACTAYSRGRRVNVTAVNLSTNSATTDNTNLSTTNRWGHVCLTGTGDQPAFTNTAGQAAATSAMPTFSVSAPILCLADVQGSSTSAGTIDNIYDVRTFTSTIKEAVNTTTASELGQLVDAGATGLVPAATCTTGTCSGKLYGVVVVTDGSTSSTSPNSIVASVGPAYVKATAGTAGQFIKSGPTAGYGETVTAIPNNAFYYSPGNTRTSWSTTCTSASNCLGSLYVNFIVR